MSTKDKALRNNILAALDADPDVDSSDLGVAARDGVVTLSGRLTSYAQRVRATEIVKRFDAVRAVVDEVKVGRPDGWADDESLALAAVGALRSIPGFPITGVKVAVEHGVLTLTGEVERTSDLRMAEQVLLPVDGVVDVRNRLRLRSHVPETDVTGRIKEAFGRTDLNSDRIRVETEGSAVRLWGEVPSWFDRDLAERLAWAVPHVLVVENKLEIRRPSDG